MKLLDGRLDAGAGTNGPSNHEGFGCRVDAPTVAGLLEASKAEAPGGVHDPAFGPSHYIVATSNRLLPCPIGDFPTSGRLTENLRGHHLGTRHPPISTTRE